jgi:tRNA(fMet)-specific endonuclease VapC
MYALDASFVIDVIRGERGAAEKVASMESVGELAAVPAPALAEVLIGAYFSGGETLRRTLQFAAAVSVAETDHTVATEAGRMGAELLKRGESLPLPDLLVAATAKVRGQVLLTRDSGFARIPGLTVENY